MIYSIQTSPFSFYLSIVYLFLTTTFLFFVHLFHHCFPFLCNLCTLHLQLLSLSLSIVYYTVLWQLLSFSLSIVYLFTSFIFFVHCVPFLLLTFLSIVYLFYYIVLSFSLSIVYLFYCSFFLSILYLFYNFPFLCQVCTFLKQLLSCFVHCVPFFRFLFICPKYTFLLQLLSFSLSICVLFFYS